MPGGGKAGPGACATPSHRPCASSWPRMNHLLTWKIASPLCGQVAVGRSVAPAYDNADVAGNAARKVDDLIADAVAARPQIVDPELVDFIRHSRQRLFPARFHLIDGTAPIGAQRIRKPVDLNFGQAVPHGTLNDVGGKLDLFILGRP